MGKIAFLHSVCLSSHSFFACFHISFVVPHNGVRASFCCCCCCCGLLLFLSLCNYVVVMSPFLSCLSIILLQNSYNCPFWVDGSFTSITHKVTPFSCHHFCHCHGSLVSLCASNHGFMCYVLNTSDFPTSDICSFVCVKSPATVCSSLMTTFIVLCKAWTLVMNSSVLLYFLYGGNTFIVSSSVKDNFSR